MHPFNHVPPAHTKLLLCIANELTEDDANKLRMRCGASDVNLPPRAMANKSAQELLMLMDQRRIFRPGKYDRLAEILADIQRMDLVSRYFGAAEDTPGALSSTGAIDTISDQEISDMLLQQFANNLGSEWKSFLRGDLGVLDRDITLIQQSMPHSPVREHIFQALKLWRDTNRSTATVTKLVEKCENNIDIEYEAYQFLLEPSEKT